MKKNLSLYLDDVRTPVVCQKVNIEHSYAPEVILTPEERNKRYNKGSNAEFIDSSEK
jgi:hypothetical protein